MDSYKKPSNNYEWRQNRIEDKTDWGVIKEIEKYAKTRLSSMAHQFDHTARVYNLALRIASEENADLLVVLPSALLHDIGREVQDAFGADHAEMGHILGKELLEGLNNFPRDKIEPVLDVIKQHRSTTGEPPQTLEAKVLFDADKLDALGAIGIARTFAYGGGIKRDVKGTIDYCNMKLLKYRDLIFTKTAKQIAESRHRYMEKFLERLEQETRGLI